MLERMCEIIEAFCFYASNIIIKVKGLTSDDNVILVNGITLLKPFEEVSKTISSDNFLILSDVIPLFATIKDVLNTGIKSKGLSKITETLKLQIDNRFQTLLNEDACTIATFLDPIY